MNIITALLTKNPCYQAGRKIAVKGLMLHSTGVGQVSGAVFASSWNDPSKNVAVHAFIDGTTGDVYQTLPWNYRGWHCGASGNNTHIGVEMCESNYIKYTGGSTFTVSSKNKKKAQESATIAYNSAVELFAFLCEQFNLNPLADGVIVSHAEGYKRGIASNHGDPEHYWSGLNMDYTMDGFRRDVAIAMNKNVTAPVYDLNTVTAKELIGRSNADVIKTLAVLCKEDAKESGVLASLSIAQAILESGYAHSELAVNANNLFGMKCSLSGNQWEGSAWDGTSVYSVMTREEDSTGYVMYIYDDFRKYKTLKESIKDHSAYLTNALNGKVRRYKGIKGQRNFVKAVNILVNGGYATDSSYANKLIDIYNTWRLAQYDVVEDVLVLEPVVETDKSRAVEYLVRVEIDDLRIRTGPGIKYDFTKYIPVGTYTIVETMDNWGKLKSGAGWICLDYVEKI